MWALGEQIGALPPGEPKAVSPRRATAVFLVVLAIALLLSWWAWAHWYSVLITALTVLWIFRSGRRWSKRRGSASEH